MSDQYEKAAVQKAIDAGAFDQYEAKRIPAKIEFAVNVADAMRVLEPGREFTPGVRVRSVQFNLRAKDRMIFAVVRATLTENKKSQRDVVGFHAAAELSTCLYEFAHRIHTGQVKWREDTPFQPDDPRDAPEPLPSW